jgi:hypothetical protein
MNNIMIGIKVTRGVVTRKITKGDSAALIILFDVINVASRIPTGTAIKKPIKTVSKVIRI